MTAMPTPDVGLRGDRGVHMETAWRSALGKDCRGSRPRCIRLVDGTRGEVAARLTGLVGLPEVVVTERDFWMPYGKPVWANGQWDKKPAAETRLDRDAGFLAPELRRRLQRWWLEVPKGANTPNWDLAATCRIEGRKGLLLVEAKAHTNELSDAGKSTPAKENGRRNHKRIGSAIEEARSGLGRLPGGSWGLSRDACYQLSNRFAWSWKLAMLGVPVVLVYLGFLNADDMAEGGVPFRSADDWAGAVGKHARGILPEACWEQRLVLDGTPFMPLTRALHVPLASNA